MTVSTRKPKAKTRGAAASAMAADAKAAPERAPATVRGALQALEKPVMNCLSCGKVCHVFI